MTLFLSLGSNQGNRKEKINQACMLITEEIGEITYKSAIYETQPWGYTDDNNYLNIAIEARTNLHAAEILKKSQAIEKHLGRMQKTFLDKNGLPLYTSRPIDIDILFLGNSIIETENLIIPHTHLHKRLFVLEPLCEIAANFVHPIYNLSVATLLQKCREVNKN